MNIKLFEIRDSKTLIPVMAMKIKCKNKKERKLLSRSGFGANPEDWQGIMLLHLCRSKIQYSIHWGNRTMTHAHSHIQKNWDSLATGDVIDIEYILGESEKKKESGIHEY